MRISDWSSDVCSSDLSLGGRWSARCRHEAASHVLFTVRAPGAARFLRAGLRLPHAADPCGHPAVAQPGKLSGIRSEEHTSELQSLMRISYAVFCLKKNNN